MSRLNKILRELIQYVPNKGAVTEFARLEKLIQELVHLQPLLEPNERSVVRKYIKSEGLEPLNMAAELRAAIKATPKEFLMAPESDEKLPSLNQEQELILNTIMSEDGPFFVTGRAGTGKSVLLKHLKLRLESQAGLTLVLAPTGIAARNVNGWTLHRVFLDMVHDVYFPNKKEWSYIRKSEHLISQVKNLVIDEASMVRADSIDRIDRALRKFKNNFDEPFGGTKLILFGDLAQLPPILNYRDYGSEATRLGQWYMNGYKSSTKPYFFMAHAFVVAPLRVFELKTNMRQRDDKVYVDFLERVRGNKITPEDESLIGEIDIAVQQELGYFLCPYRDQVEKFNQEKLNELPTPLHVFECQNLQILDKEKYDEAEFDDETAAPMRLELKIGAQVMFVRNSPYWQNGTLGKVIGFTDNSISVETSDGAFDVYREIFDQTYPDLVQGIGLESILIASMEQFPLMLAWAVTVHKAQGLTLPRVTLDLRRAFFESGQAYVALSRCTNLESLSRVGNLTQESLIIYPETIFEFFQLSTTLVDRQIAKDNIDAQIRLLGLSESQLDAFYSNSPMLDSNGYNRLRQMKYLSDIYRIGWYWYLVSLYQTDQKASKEMLVEIARRINQ